MRNLLKKLSIAEQRAYLHLIDQAPFPVSRKDIALASMATKVSIDPISEGIQGAVIICSIRKKLGEEHFIKTRRGFGYIYTGELREA